MAQTLMITLTINPGLKQAETLLWAQALHLTPALPASPQLRPRQLGTLDASPQRSEYIAADVAVPVASAIALAVGIDTALAIVLKLGLSLSVALVLAIPPGRTRPHSFIISLIQALNYNR